MKIPSKLPLLGLALVLGLFSCENHTPQADPGAQQADLPAVQDQEAPHKGPGHPGYFEQWHAMRADVNGHVPEDYLWQVHLAEQANGQRVTTTVLNNVMELGPDNVGGRTRGLIIDVSNHDHMIAGGISGGIWTSTDRGMSWAPVDDHLPTLSVTYISQDPNLPDEIYFSTGEVRGNSAGIGGMGIFKSTDHGQSFQQLPATSSFGSTWRVQVSPVQPGHVYAATRNAGLQRSTDGGNTWAAVFSGAEVSDVEIFPDSSVMIGVRTEGIYHSPTGDAGTFVQYVDSVPTSGIRRVELEYCDSFPEVVYALFESDNGSDVARCIKTTDGGTTWASTANPEDVINFSFPWYCLMLGIQPNNPNMVFAGGASLAYTTDGGNSWGQAASSHADYHITTWDLDNPALGYIGNDGGIYQYSAAFPTGSPGDRNDGYGVTQFYTGAYWPEDDLMGGTQDNGTQASRMGGSSFQHIRGGDGAFCAVNQQNPNFSYVSYQNGIIARASNSLQTFPTYSGILNELDGDNNNSVDDGAWFINPFDINLVDGNQLYFVTLKRVWRSTNGGTNWSELTNFINNGNDNPYIVGISQDPSPTVYIGGERAMFYRVDNADVAVPGDEVNLSTTVPNTVTGDFISSIKVHPDDASTVYVSFSTVSTQDRIWKVTNANTGSPTWTPIGGDLPDNLPVNWVEAHFMNPDSFLLAGTDYGLYVSENGGQTWQKELRVPNVPIGAVKIRPYDWKVLVWTHGRGVFTADWPVLASVEQGLTGEVELWPNPAADELRVRVGGRFSEGMSYEVLDLNGKVAAHGSLNGESIDIRALAAGTYVLRIMDATGPIATRKFIKNTYNR